MKNFSRDNDRSGGWNGGRSAGPSAPWKRHTAGNFERPELHDATCADCGNRCQVPFRPNGSKPVLCRDCFKKGDGSEPKRFGEKRPFSKPYAPSRPYAPRDNGGSQIDERLKAIEGKLDAVLKALATE